MKLSQSTGESIATVVRSGHVRGKTAVFSLNYARSSPDPDVVMVHLKHS